MSKMVFILGVLLIPISYLIPQCECKGDCQNGYGEFICKNGDRYIGYWRYGKREGQGTEIIDGIIRYKGEWKNNVPHGKGIYYNEDGTMYYKGEFVNRFPHGKGIRYIRGLGRYEGNFVYAEISGKGVFYYDNGQMLDGEWKGLEILNGTYYYNGRKVYEGEFKNNLPHGKGINNLPHEKGIYYWEDGRKYVGEWRYGNREGQGTLYDKDEKVIYAGIWKNDEFVKETSYYAIVILDPYTLGGPLLIPENPVSVSENVVDIGVGHIAIILVTDKEVYYYSKSKPSFNKRYDSIKDFLIDKIDNDYNSRYTQKYRIKIDIDSYGLMTNRAIEKLKEDYSIKSNNCVHFVHAVLEAGKLIVPNPNCSPKDYFNSLTKSGLGEIYNEN